MLTTYYLFILPTWRRHENIWCQIGAGEKKLEDRNILSSLEAKTSELVMVPRGPAKIYSSVM